MLDTFKPAFARNFIAASSQYLERDEAVATAVPITMACWFNSTLTATAQTLMGLFNSGDDGVYMRLKIGEVASNVSAESRSSLAGPSQSNKGNYVANTWHHAAGVWATVSSRTAYLDGAAGTAETTSITPSGLNRTGIGRLGRPSALHYMSGMIAWPAFWSVALDASDIAKLACGASPLTVKPESLLQFWDWTGAETEFGINANPWLINVNTTPVGGPGFLRTRIRRQAIARPPAGAAPTSKPFYFRHYIAGRAA